jgi:uncharacterized protein (DUF427 family)
MSSDVKPIVHDPSSAGAILELSERWVRVKLGGETIADSKHPLLLIEYGPGKLPTYFFPESAVRVDLLAEPVERRGRRYWTVRAGGKEALSAAWAYLTPPQGLAALAGHITFKWGALHWFEEEEQVFVHARDPHKRVDVMPSSRHVRVEVGGVTVAETQRPTLLFETGLPIRYYLPAEDVRMEYLRPTARTSRCPYKGIAAYWTVEAGDVVLEDAVWSYPDPIPENPKIKGLLCFFNEMVDLYVDGELQARPVTPWS